MPISVGAGPAGVAFAPDGARAYVANAGEGTLSAIDVAGRSQIGDGSTVYVTTQGTDTVTVIDTSTDTVVGTPISVGTSPTGIAMTPDGSRAYVVNGGDDTVSVIEIGTAGPPRPHPGQSGREPDRHLP